MKPIFVSGEPVPQPRHKFRIIGKGKSAIPVPYLPAKHEVHAWKDAVRLTFKSEMNRPPFDQGALSLSLGFVLGRPDSRIKKRSDNAREWHDRRPDVDNLAKAVMDALKGIAWKDDAQVCQLSVGKVMANATELPGVWITVLEVQDSPSPMSAGTPRWITPGLFE